jgi:N-acetylmuramoyl-L-alanine amidase
MRNRFPTWTAVTIAVALVAGCTTEPTRPVGTGIWTPSPNFNERRPNFVILHHTGDPGAQASLNILTNRLREVSAHYLVGRDGAVYHLVDERMRAWHAGLSYWGANSDLNSASIGIELDNDGREPFPDAQIASLLDLLADIKSRYSIPAANFLGHADVAPGRKVDPSAYFPWARLAEHGFGLWCDPPYASPPREFDADLGLRAFGYDMTNRDAAIYAFKLHFNQRVVDTRLTDEDRAMLYCLLKRGEK